MNQIIINSIILIALQMMKYDGVKILVNTLKPNFLSIPVDSHARLTICEFVIMLLSRMFALLQEKRNESSETSALFEPLRITRSTLE